MNFYFIFSSISYCANTDLSLKLEKHGGYKLLLVTNFPSQEPSLDFLNEGLSFHHASVESATGETGFGANGLTNVQKYRGCAS